MESEKETSSPVQKCLWPLFLLGTAYLWSALRSRQHLPVHEAICPDTDKDHTENGSKPEQRLTRPAAPEADSPTALTQAPFSKEIDYWKKGRKWVIAVTQVLTMIAVIWYAYISNRQLNQMVQADRPWLAPSQTTSGEPAIHIQPNNPTTEPDGTSVIWNSIDVWVQNGGRSPAYIEVAEAGWHFYKLFPRTPEFLCSVRTEPETRTVIPGSRLGFSCILKEREKIEFSADWYAFANVEYIDIRTNSRYHSHICKQYDPSTKAFTKACDTYNDAN